MLKNGYRKNGLGSLIPGHATWFTKLILSLLPRYYIIAERHIHLAIHLEETYSDFFEAPKFCCNYEK